MALKSKQASASKFHLKKTSLYLSGSIAMEISAYQLVLDIPVYYVC